MAAGTPDLMNIPIGTYGDPLSLEKTLVIDSFNHTFVDGVSGVRIPRDADQRSELMSITIPK
jgi:hypothetical protein